jgi:O-antigen ligase
MNKTLLEKKYSNFVIALLLLFPVLINSVKIFGNLILLILAVLGAYIIVTEKKNPFQLPELKLFSWLTMGYFLVMLFSIIYADGLNGDFYHLGRKLHFLLAPLIGLAIFQIDLPLKRLLLSIKLGLIVIAIIAISQYADLIPSLVRKTGMMNSNIFGDIAVAMLFLSIVHVFIETPKQRIITFVSILAGIIAIILSSSRGSWVSLIALFTVYISLIYKPFLQKNNKLKILLLLLFLTIVTLVATQTNVGKRIFEAVTEVKNWTSGNEKFSSNGNRLKMWQSGLRAAEDAPWLGYGYRNANKAASEYTENNKDWVKAATHLHNEYITNLVSAGILGLITLLTLLFAPIIVFYRSLKSNRFCSYSIMGILLCSGYITFGFTHVAFGEEHINAFYVLFMGFLLPRSIESRALIL